MFAARESGLYDSSLGEEGDLREQEQCWKAVEDSVNGDIYISHLLASLKKSGCSVDPRKFFHCMPCPNQNIAGFYDRASGIVICQNAFKGTRKVAETLRHELIHAYDDCRADLEWEKCEHHACSEIRAANLSGDCHWRNELLRGNGSKWRAQHQECVRRRARISISFNPNCSGREDEVLDRMWTSCTQDTAPYGFVP